MAMVTDYTLAGYNSYTDITTMDDLMASLAILNGDIGWGALSIETKQTYLIYASKSLQNTTFEGALNVLVIADELMHFPRTGLYYPNGNAVPDDTIPAQINNYLACYIYDWISNGRSTVGTSGGNVKEKSIGDVSVKYDSAAISTEASGEDHCEQSNIPEGWITYEVTSSLGGVGSVAKVR